MGGEALGPVKAQCHSVGECQGQEARVDGLVSRRMGSGRDKGSVFFGGETRNRDNI